MGVAKFLIPALSVASSAYAATCSISSTTTISNPAGASALAGCPSFTGSIVIQTGTADSAGTVSLGTLKKIDGDLSYENDKDVQTFSASSLSTITGSLLFGNLSALSDTGLSGLQNAGSLTFTGLAVLSKLGLGAISQVGMVTIGDTMIPDLGGVQNVSQITGLDVSNNQVLSQISLSVKEIKTISVGPNNVNGQTALFPSLVTADSVIIRNCTDVELPKLTNVTSNIELLGNTFKNFTAPKLGLAGGVVVNNNIALSNLSFPELYMIGPKNSTLEIANNTKLDSIAAFPLLTNVTGGVIFIGNFSEVRLDKITYIGGALNVDTASSNFDCKQLTTALNKVVKGSETCHFADKTKIGGTSTGTSSSAAATSSGFGTPLEIPGSFMSGFAALAGALSLFM